MSDPVSIAGLTIAIFDQLVKLGERTAGLVSDIKSFGEVSYPVFPYNIELSYDDFLFHA